MTMNTEELLALVESWRAGDGYGQHHKDGILRAADELAPIATALCAEVEALRKDAERYRWLRDEARQVNAIAPLVFMADDFGVPSIVLDHSDLDAAIDAATRKESDR